MRMLCHRGGSIINERKNEKIAANFHLSNVSTHSKVLDESLTEMSSSKARISFDGCRQICKRKLTLLIHDSSFTKAFLRIY